MASPFNGYLKWNKKIELGETSSTACNITYDGALKVNDTAVVVDGSRQTFTASGNGTNDTVTIGDSTDGGEKDIKIDIGSSKYFYYHFGIATNSETGYSEQLWYYDGASSSLVRETVVPGA